MQAAGSAKFLAMSSHTLRNERGAEPATASLTSINNCVATGQQQPQSLPPLTRHLLQRRNQGPGITSSQNALSRQSLR